MSQQMTFWPTDGSTGSQGSAGGNSPSASRAGRKKSPSGQAPARASRSRPRAAGAPSKTTETSGPSSPSASASAALSWSLGSRLSELCGTDGSIECRQTWKRKATSSGLPYWAHIASARRTSDSASTGSLTAYPTPRAEDGDSSGARISRGTNDTLTLVARLMPFSVYLTPRTPTGGAESAARKKELGRMESGGSDLESVARTFAHWTTPLVNDAKNCGNSGQMNRHHLQLNAQVTLALWTTPTAGDAASSGSRNTGQSSAHAGYSLTDQVRGDSGTGRGSSESSAATVASGASLRAQRVSLNPRFSLWLMGFPAGWDDFAPPATRSSRKSPRRS